MADDSSFSERLLGKKFENPTIVNQRFEYSRCANSVHAGQSLAVFACKKSEFENRRKFEFFAKQTLEIGEIVGNSIFLSLGSGA